MPELPEVETICRGLKRPLQGARLQSLRVRDHRLRQPIPTDLALRAVGSTVRSINRRAKYILLELSNGYHILIHLGMSGRLLIKGTSYIPQKHDHVLFHFEHNQCLVYHDPRRFGLIDIQKSVDLSNHHLLNHLGVEPLSKGFNGKVLKGLLKKRGTSIKSAIMNQNLLVGVGNIYASEALYHASLHPKRIANTLTSRETEALAKSIKKVLNRAIKSGGSSLRDYVTPDGQAGNFQKLFFVYDQEGAKCKKCQRGQMAPSIIQRCVIQGRSSFFCPNHQK